MYWGSEGGIGRVNDDLILSYVYINTLTFAIIYILFMTLIIQIFQSTLFIKHTHNQKQTNKQTNKQTYIYKKK
jgi:hypothetical protein